MSRRIVDHPGALEDYANQADYLEARSAGLGDRFIDQAERVLEEIAADPHGRVRVPEWDGEPTLYRVRIRPFRVHVVYYLDGDLVRVIAYAHEAREPGYWRDRIGAWPA
jgi:plasmid stabilization system protein ParE